MNGTAEGGRSRWHFTLKVSDDSHLDSYRARITVMFDGILRCNLLHSSLAKDEEIVIADARKKVLVWIAEYRQRNGTDAPVKT